MRGSGVGGVRRVQFSLAAVLLSRRYESKQGIGVPECKYLAFIKLNRSRALAADKYSDGGESIIFAPEPV